MVLPAMSDGGGGGGGGDEEVVPRNGELALALALGLAFACTRWTSCWMAG